MRILFVADVIGSPGRKVAKGLLRLVRKEARADAVVLNGENSAGGFGITPEIVHEFLDMGVDVITTGNHVWDKIKELEPVLREGRLPIIRPANYPAGNPGRGAVVVEVGGVLNSALYAGMVKRALADADPVLRVVPPVADAVAGALRLARAALASG